MTGRTHDLAAITALGAVAFALHPHTITLSTVLVAVFANQIGGITPDIDQPTAPLWKNLPIGHPLGKFTDALMGGHRFLTHSILGLALFGFLAFTLLKFLSPIMHSVDTMIVWWAFMIGMVSHLIMDSFTKEGVPWLLPITTKFGLPPEKALRITTGHFVELFIIFPALLLLDGWYCVSHYHHLLLLMHQYVI
ncbi:MAG TPA: metal-dependent hydrolase [Candidatus Saccharimonadales bacterium]|nr:metal-dependent hydrolase [Candidatus Saccharimonadales bacterium]